MLHYNKYILLSLLTTSLFANDDSLSKNKNDLINYSYSKALQDSDKLKKDWINPITYKYIYNNGENYTTQKSFISISQPIFKSGGIYSAIKYANSIEKYSNTSIDGQKKELIKQTINILFQIQKLDINIKKQKLLIENSQIDIQRKKEQVLNGILDSSFLDNSILDSNAKQNALIDLEYTKEELINTLTNFSDKKYMQLDIPTFSIIDDITFIKNNIYIKQSKEEIENSYWLSKMTKANYMPTINFTADYTKYHDNGNYIGYTDATNIGFNITIPLDIKYSNSIESSKIEYLQKKIALEDKKIEELSLFKSSIAKIKSLDKKIEIAKNDVTLYDSLLTQIVEQLSVGMKTKSDVDTMKNSKDIKKLDIQTLNIDKQIELLDIYSRTYSE